MTPMCWLSHKTSTQTSMQTSGKWGTFYREPTAKIVCFLSEKGPVVKGKIRSKFFWRPLSIRRRKRNNSAILEKIPFRWGLVCRKANWNIKALTCKNWATFRKIWHHTCIGQSHWSAKSRSGAQGHSAFLKSMMKTNTMQGLTLAAITTTQKRTLMLDST